MTEKGRNLLQDTGFHVERERIVTNPRGKATVRPIRKTQSVAAAAASGDERALLVALRETLAQAITDGCHARDLAPLTRRLRETAGALRADESLRPKAEQNWYILYGEPLPS